MFDFTNEEILLRGMMNRGNEMKVFDWDRAAQLIKDRKPKEAIAGLSEDWFWTAGTIFFDGKPVIHGGTYLASTWATPVLVLDDGEEIPCWRMQSETPEWDADTKWPESARSILSNDTAKCANEEEEN